MRLVVPLISTQNTFFSIILILHIHCISPHKTKPRLLSENDKKASGLELDFLITSSCLLFFIILIMIVIVLINRRKKSVHLDEVERRILQDEMDVSRSAKIEKTNERIEESEVQIEVKPSKESFISKPFEAKEIVFDNVKRVTRKKKKEENYIDEENIRGYYLDTFNQEKRSRVIEKQIKATKIRREDIRPKPALRKKSFIQPRVDSEGSKISAKKIAGKITKRDLVQYTNENRSSPESSFDEEDFCDDDPEPVEEIKSPINKKEILKKIEKIINSEQNEDNLSRRLSNSFSSNSDEDSDQREKVKFQQSDEESSKRGSNKKPRDNILNRIIV